MIGPLIISLIITSAPAPNLKVVVDGKSFDVSKAQIEKLPTHDVELKEHDGTISHCTGPLVVDLLATVGIATGDHVRGKELATYVLAKASDGYEVVYGLAELEPSISGRNTILAYLSNGKSLIPSQGPLRVVIEGIKMQAPEIRMVIELDVVHLRP